MQWLELVRPQLERRQAMNNLSRQYRFIINTALHQHPTQAQVGEVSSTDKRKRDRCKLCPRHRDLKTTMRCSMCKNSVCSTHSKKAKSRSLLPRIGRFFQKRKVGLLYKFKKKCHRCHPLLLQYHHHPFVLIINNILYLSIITINILLYSSLTTSFTSVS